MVKQYAPILIVITAEGQEQKIAKFQTRTIKVGRLPTVNLHLNDPNVNRIHAVIEVISQEEAQVIDMGSSKGTIVNGNRIHKSRLLTGDQIQLGSTILTIHVGNDAITRYNNPPQTTKFVPLQQEESTLIQSLPKENEPNALHSPEPELTQVSALPNQLFATEQNVTQNNPQILPTKSPQAVQNIPWNQTTPTQQTNQRVAQFNQPQATQPQATRSPIQQAVWSPPQQPQHPKYPMTKETEYVQRAAPAASLQAPPHQATPQARKQQELLTHYPPVIRYNQPRSSLPQISLTPVSISSDEALEIRVIWGDTVLKHAHFISPKQITIGESRKNTFSLSSDALPDNLNQFPLVEGQDEHLFIQFTDEMSGTLKIGQFRYTFEQLKQMNKTQVSIHGNRFALPTGAIAHINVGDMVFELKVERAPKVMPGLTGIHADRSLGRALGTSFLMHGLVLLLMLFADENPKTFDETFDHSNSRFSSIVLRPDKPEKPKKKTKTGDKKAPGTKGKMGQKKLASKNRRAGQIKKNFDAKSPVNLKKMIGAVQNNIMRKGFLGIINGGKIKKGSILDAKGIGGGDMRAMGQWHGTKIGAAGGNGGLGTKGSGNSGGGLDGNTVGTGSVGTFGPHGGKGDRNGRSMKLKGPRSNIIKPEIGHITMVGGLDRKMIQRIINQNRRKFKYCYERELIKNQQLSGKIHVKFQIEGNGRVHKASISKSTMNNDRVEQCIAQRVRYMRFPAPSGGGIVLVNYPFVFRPAGK